MKTKKTENATPAPETTTTVAGTAETTTVTVQPTPAPEPQPVTDGKIEITFKGKKIRVTAIQPGLVQKTPSIFYVQDSVTLEWLYCFPERKDQLLRKHNGDLSKYMGRESALKHREQVKATKKVESAQRAKERAEKSAKTAMERALKAADVAKERAAAATLKAEQIAQEAATKAAALKGEPATV